MKNIIRIIGASLAAMAGILLVSGVAWAQATQEPVWGQVVSTELTDSGEQWEDDDGFHLRNRKRTHQFTGHIAGELFSVMSLNEDPDTFDVRMHGFFSFVGEVPGGLVTATGTEKGKCDRLPDMRLLCEHRRVWHLSDGGVIKTTESTELGTFPFDYVGIIYDNPGRN